MYCFYIDWKLLDCNLISLLQHISLCIYILFTNTFLCDEIEDEEDIEFNTRDTFVPTYKDLVNVLDSLNDKELLN